MAIDKNRSHHYRKTDTGTDICAKAQYKGQTFGAEGWPVTCDL